MDNYQKITLLLKNKINNTVLLENKVLLTSCYKNLNTEIPEDKIVISEVIPDDEYETVLTNFAPYMEIDNLLPFLVAMGGNQVFCIGYGAENYGLIYYYDMDFGCFELEGDNLDNFLLKLA
ncbi:hypothetical protein [Phocoenobacter atlanticus]|uniref:hypothetical protein n=1 Tax=Phocoenobacter atlanticus TaxID=3416742 RepID=UPI0027690477|nr:hypothetical protein [Pasteurella atlantica]MDP8100342.1 hypothetical protein [Pasteurella atlantica]